MARKPRTEPETLPEDREDEIESMDAESREHWLRHPYTQRSLVAAHKAVMDSRAVLMEKANNSDDPEVVGAFKVYTEKLQLRSFLKEGQQS